jgi:large subunit ribosomal protein L31e
MEKEQIYTVPLRMAKRVPRWRRSRRAVIELRDYLARHMKTPVEMVKINESLNEAIWARSNEKPVPRIRVKAVKFEDGEVEAEFAGER